jgi:uridylate kinase
LSSAAVVALPSEVEDDLDAFLKRYEQLVNTIQDELFKVVAIVGGEDIRGLARREVAELMARLGALPSAASFRLLVTIRNRIAHVYPDDPERQAANLNAAYEAVPDLLAAGEGVRRYLEKRLPRPRDDD